MKTAVVFFGSVAMAALFLAIERIAGIPWDFHPDSITYATLADDTVRSILAQSYFSILNNGYYFWASLLGMSVFWMTTANIIMFASTNVALFRFHERYCINGQASARWLIALSLLMVNPYRLHLATTALKDTMILLIVVLMALGRRRVTPWLLPFLLALRVASAFYLLIKLKRNQLFQLLFVAILASLFFANELSDRLLDFNAADMQFREFDKIPNFRPLGLFGTLARAVTWPALAITGTFAVVSPALAFFPVAIGSITNQIYCRLATGRFAAPLAVLVPMAIIAALVTGYTAYIRYAYPLLAVLPIVAVQQRFAQELASAKSGVLNPPYLS